MNYIFTALLFMGSGASCFKAVECWHAHQWAGWAWLMAALIAACAGMWRMESK